MWLPTFAVMNSLASMNADFLEISDHRHDKAYISARIRDEGPYGDSEGLNFFMGISGPPAGER